MAKHGLWIGSILGFFAVLLGAFGAHGLETWFGDMAADELKDRLETWKTGDRYLMVHAVVIFLVGMLGQFNRHKALQWTLYCFLAGAIVFSGSLFILVLTGQTWLGMVAPVGGLLLMAGSC